MCILANNLQIPVGIQVGIQSHVHQALKLSDQLKQFIDSITPMIPNSPNNYWSCHNYFIFN